jgi:porin
MGVALILMVTCGIAVAADPAPKAPAAETESSFFDDLCTRDTLTGNWFGLGDQLEESTGITIGLSLTQIMQMNLQGGLATHRHAGRYTGSYDLEGTFDLEKLLGIPDAIVYAHAEGGWSNGLDASSIGSVFGVNADAFGDQAIQLSQLYYEQGFFDGRLRVRIGKLDLTGGFECRGCPVSFDGNAFANDETAQFLNGALVNNPTIPFPDYGLGVVVYAEPIDGFYIGAGVADAQADGRETGFNTTFHDEDYFFAIFETGVVVLLPSANGDLPGAYRIGFWYDPQDKERHTTYFDPERQADVHGTKRDDMGLYISVDQLLFKEVADEEDSQGLGVFARWGWADRSVAEVKCFWSTGLQYQGLIPGRDDDVFAVGVAQGTMVKPAGFDKNHETVMEIYYNTQITPWFTLTPSLQFVWDPGAVNGVGDATVIGMRAQLTF